MRTVGACTVAGRAQRRPDSRQACPTRTPAREQSEEVAALTTDQVLVGLGLIVVLAVGSQVVASRLRIPALIILLPVGFTAGALTSEVDPQRLLGPAFQPLVSLAVAVILYNAGLGLDLRKADQQGRVVRRLIIVGVPLTWGLGGLFAGLLLGLSSEAAIMIGAILVVSGPTVVDPLLGFVQPTQRIRRALSWEGSLIDPIGGVLGAVVFNAVARSHHVVSGQFVLTIVVGVVGAAIGVAVLWLCLVKLDVGKLLATITQLACAVGIGAACDVVRDDAGLIATILMGLAVANMRVFAARHRDPFFETLVQFLIGLLFVSISATVTPASLRHVVLPTLGLVAVLVLVARPLVAFIATSGSELRRGERAFIGWMAPRGIVAAATASTFTPVLVAQHIGGASKILPATFLVIVATVVIYGLSAIPVADLLGVRRRTRASTLVVGGQPWVIDVARALRQSGLAVTMWADTQRQRDEIERAGIEFAPAEELASALARGAELEGVSRVLLLTDEDGLNTLASTVLAAHHRIPVYCLAPRDGGYGVMAQAGATRFASALTHDDIVRRYRSGSRITARAADGASAGGADVLFLVDRDGDLRPATTSGAASPEPGDTAVVLEPVAAN